MSSETTAQWAGRKSYEADTLSDVDEAQIAQATPWFTRLLIRVFGRRLNRLIYRIIARYYERGVIDSRQRHLLLRQFDPTQGGIVGRLSRSRKSRSLNEKSLTPPSAGADHENLMRAQRENLTR